MGIRTASVAAAFMFAVAAPAWAQGPGQPALPNYPELVAQVASLQARIAKLEGNVATVDLAGTYTLTALNTSMTAAHPGLPPVNATITTTGGQATLTLNADGTGSFSNFRCQGSTLTQGPWSMHGVDCSQSGTETATWTYADGVVTIRTPDGEEVPYTVALGGRLLIVAFAPFHPSDPSSDQAVLIATRLK